MGIKTRLFSIALIMALIASLSGCAAPPIVIDGEEKAKAVYTCSPDNMYGLERIVIFKYEVVIVFDKAVCEKNSRYGGSLRNVKDDRLRVYVTMDNADGIVNAGNKIEERDGKYIVTKMCYEDRKCDPDKDVTIESISVNNKAVFINGGDFYLIAGKPIEGSTKYTQEYDSQKGTWGEIGSYVVPRMETVPNGTAD